jgi:hypothetical protein
MSNTAITALVAACCGVAALSAFVGLIVVPTIQAYSRAWERVAAVFLSLYVLAALLGMGVVLGGVIVLNWTKVF